MMKKAEAEVGQASQRKVAGTLHWVSIQHALEAEVRLYDRLFIDEAQTVIKRKFLRIYESKFVTNCEGFVEPSLNAIWRNSSFNVWVISM
jgi:glutaminyl-tRNA synthetase